MRCEGKGCVAAACRGSGGFSDFQPFSAYPLDREALSDGVEGYRLSGLR